MILRQYQTECVDAIWDSLCASDTSRPLAVLPTGAGKSLVLAALINRAPDARIVVLAHRKELLSQNASKIAAVAGIPPAQMGVMCAGLKQRKAMRVTVASIQTVVNRPEELGPINLAIVDEAHLISHNTNSSYQKLFAGLKEQNPKFRIAGLTATPFRMGTGLLYKGPKAVFSDMCCNIPMRRLIDEGYLSPLISRHSKEQVNTEGVATQHGDFVVSQLSTKVDDILPQILDECIEKGKDRRSWLLFFPSVEIAEKAALLLNEKGVPSEVIIGRSENRLAVFHRHKIGATRAICSVDVLTTGYDAPYIDMLVLARPTKSVGLFVQMVGRGSRLSPETFKKNCLVLDFGGNIERHGPVDAIDVQEKEKGKKGTPPFKICPTCGLSNPISVRVCEDPSCGHIFPEPEKGKNLKGIASSESILAVPEEWGITNFNFTQGQKEGKPPFLHLKFYQGAKHASMFLWFEGWMANKSKGWWSKYVSPQYPLTIEQATKVLLEWEFPRKITVIKEGKYWKVL